MPETTSDTAAPNDTETRESKLWHRARECVRTTEEVMPDILLEQCAILAQHRKRIDGLWDKDHRLASRVTALEALAHPPIAQAQIERLLAEVAALKLRTGSTVCPSCHGVPGVPCQIHCPAVAWPGTGREQCRSWRGHDGRHAFERAARDALCFVYGHAEPASWDGGACAICGSARGEESAALLNTTPRPAEPGPSPRAEDVFERVTLRAAAAAMCPGCKEGRPIKAKASGSWWHLTFAEPHVPHFVCHFAAARTALDPTGEILAPSPEVRG